MTYYRATAELSQPRRENQRKAHEVLRPILRGEKGDTAKRGVMFVGPCGIGKTRIAYDAAHEAYLAGKSCVIVTSVSSQVQEFARLVDPSVDLTDASDAKIWSTAEKLGVYTAVRLRNRIKSGKLPAPQVVVVDECDQFHEEAGTPREIRDLCPESEFVGVTATPFGATYKFTRAIEAYWPTAYELVSRPVAVHRTVQGIEDTIVQPELHVRHLANDEVAEWASTGELTISAANDLYGTDAAYQSLLDMVEEWSAVGPAGVWLPYVEIANGLDLRARLRGLPTSVITGETPLAERRRIESLLVQGGTSLITVGTALRGWNCPALAVQIDARPTQSVALWDQMIGRISRAYREPDGTLRRKHYVCTNGNLIRFAYRFRGLLPPQQYAAIVSDVPPEARPTGSGWALRNLEGSGRVKVYPLPLADGTSGEVVHLQAWDEESREGREYMLLTHPLTYEPTWLTRPRYGAKGRFVKSGRWRRLAKSENLDSVRGMISSGGKGFLSMKQIDWWAANAEKVGLDQNAIPDSQSVFDACMAMLQTGVRLGGGV